MQLPKVVQADIDSYLRKDLEKWLKFVVAYSIYTTVTVELIAAVARVHFDPPIAADYTIQIALKLSFRPSSAAS